jgi:Domain of unknown function (DUF4377)
MSLGDTMLQLSSYLTRSSMTRLIALALLLSTLVGCDVLGLGGPARFTLIIQHYAEECKGFIIQRCLLVKPPNQADFHFLFGDIEGFVYEWGSVYTLEVEEHQVSNPPQDASPTRLVLRKLISKTPVSPGTEFDLILTAGEGRVLEVSPDRYRFFGTVEFSCPSGTACADLRAEIAAGKRVQYRFAHVAVPGQPLTVVRWKECTSPITGLECQ